ncbi:MAG: BatD family protein [Bacteroidota bacterium]|nr:BatD family protein [Bacteroidota bacterium]
MSKSVYHTRLVTLLFFSAGIFCVQNISAQLPQVKTSVDKNNILIGEQIQYKVESSMPDNSYRLTWFSIPDSFGHFVVVSKSKIDSSFVNGTIRFSQVLTLTSFDSGRAAIPSLSLTAEPLNADSSYNLLTDTIPINISYSPLDSVKTFHDIKNIIEVKKELPWWIWLLLSIAFLIIIFLVIFLIKVFRKKQNIPDLIKAKLTPYDEAMQALTDLDKQQLLQKNEPDNYRVKEYHTRLSEIFKRYITRKTNTYKLHLTSDEILMELGGYGIEKDQLSAFANSIRMSNAVKFAKYIPPQSESENCLHQTKEMITQINNNLNRKSESVS